MRPTTKDLAKHVGVSRATIDRVLNGRTGVRPETISAVSKAIEELGFERNLNAANLAKSRTYRFSFFLPEIGGAFLDEVENQIRQHVSIFRKDNIDLTIKRVLSLNPHRIAETLSKITKSHCDGIAVMGPESPQLRDALHRLGERGVQVIQFISGRNTPKKHDYVGIDNIAAGATAGRLLGQFYSSPRLQNIPGNVLTITETLTARDSLERRLGFSRVLQNYYPHLSTLPTIETYSDPRRTEEVLQRAFKNFKDIIGVYVMNAEARKPLDTVFKINKNINPIIIAHERTQDTEKMLIEGRLHALITQNTGHLVRSAVRLLKGQCDHRSPISAQENIRIEILLKENLGAFSDLNSTS